MPLYARILILQFASALLSYAAAHQAVAHERGHVEANRQPGGELKMQYCIDSHIKPECKTEDQLLISIAYGMSLYDLPKNSAGSPPEPSMAYAAERIEQSALRAATQFDAIQAQRKRHTKQYPAAFNFDILLDQNSERLYAMAMSKLLPDAKAGAPITPGVKSFFDGCKALQKSTAAEPGGACILR